MSTPSRSSAGRGPLIAATIIALAVIVTIAVLVAGAAPRSRGVWQSFFPPPPATDQAREIKQLYDIVFYIAVAIFLIVEVAIVYTVFRYRRKPGDDELPPQTHGNNLVEIIWTVIPTIIVAVLFFLSWQSLNKVDTVSAEVPVQIRAVAARFQWSFDYLEPASTEPARDKALFTQFLPQGEGGGMVVPVGAEGQDHARSARTSSTPSTSRASCSSGTSCPAGRTSSSSRSRRRASTAASARSCAAPSTAR